MSRSTIRKGSKGSDVKYCQERLIALGYSVGKWGADGDFGQGTDDAVRQFQAGRNLTPDGIVGKGTWKALEGSSETGNKDPSDEMNRLSWLVPKGIEESRSLALHFAISFLGADEIPDGSNWGPEIEHTVAGYNEYWGLSTSKYGRLPWCAMFCSSAIGRGSLAGRSSADMDWSKTPMKKFFGGASQFEEWGKKAGVWVEETEAAAPGAVFCMARGGSGSDPAGTAKAGHVGMIICDNGNGTVTTIEGNVSNGCRSYTRKKSDLHGFIEWWKV